MSVPEAAVGKKLALFDFDGTLTRKDTLFEVLRWMAPRAFYRRMILCMPFLILFKLRCITATAAKERLLTTFLNGMPVDAFQAGCDQFVRGRLPQILRKEAVAALVALKNQGADIFVVSASAENWIRPWCRQQGIGCIASALEVVDGKLTGRLKGNNCNGTEKVNRIKAGIDLSSYTEIFAFGDSSGDRPMLALAGRNGFFQTFDMAQAGASDE